MSEQTHSIDRTHATFINLLHKRRRMVAVGVGTLSLAVAACSPGGSPPDENGIDYYAHGPTPHQLFPAIAEGKVFPTDGTITFMADGTAEYKADDATSAMSGIDEIIAFCGNPADQRDANRNVYAHITTSKGNESIGPLPDFAPCKDDGKLAKGDEAALQYQEKTSEIAHATPHQLYPKYIPGGRIFPEGEKVVFDDNKADITASRELTAKTGISQIQAFCVESMRGVVKIDIITSGNVLQPTSLAEFEPCDDKKLDLSELDKLQPQKTER